MIKLCLRIVFAAVIACSMYSTDLLAQRLTFADTYPANNIDSLKTWLKTHPQPTAERLKNLIRLERTYYFMYPENMGDHLAEIKFLAKRLRNPLGRAAYHYVEGRILVRNEKRPDALEEFQRAYLEFLSLKDTSGVIHALAGLVIVNYGISGNVIGDTLRAEHYLKTAEALLKNRPDGHDSFFIMTAHNTCHRGKSNTDYRALLKYNQTFYQRSERSPEYAYARISVMNNIAVCNQYNYDFDIAYQVYKKLLSHLAPNQLFIRIRSLYSLSVTCGTLQRRTEQLHLCEEAIALMEQLKKKCAFPQMEYNLIHTLQEVYVSQKNFEKAHYYTYQLLVIDRHLTQSQNSEVLVALTKKYELSEKQKQIAELTLQQTKTENRNRLILILLSIAVAVAIAFGFLGLRLRQANTRLKHLTQAREYFLGIVAHDVRRPLSSFHGMAEMVNSAIKEGDFSAIEALSRSVDQSGAQIQQLLDNIVTWALSQREELPYQPVFFSLHERVRYTAEMYRAIYATKKPTFELLIDDMWQVYMDINAFDLIVRNLIDNSLKATGQPIHIKITARYQSSEYIEVCFEDNAGGMSPQKIAAVQRVFDNPKRAQINQNGLGVGLVMIGRFVKRNQGSISIISTLGKGTSYTLTLPGASKGNRYI